MKDLNKVLLIGRLGNDPVRRETKNGTPVTHFSLATSSYKAGDTPEQSSEETTWHDIVVWGRQAEICFQYLKKGRTIYVEGTIRKRNYTTKEGQPRVSLEIHADSVGFLGGLNTSRDSDHETASEQAFAS